MAFLLGKQEITIKNKESINIVLVVDVLICVRGIIVFDLQKISCLPMDEQIDCLEILTH